MQTRQFWLVAAALCWTGASLASDRAEFAAPEAAQRLQQHYRPGMWLWSQTVDTGKDLIEISGTLELSWKLGKHFLAFVRHEQGRTEPVEEGMLGWDSQSGQYRMLTFDADGGISSLRGEPEGADRIVYRIDGESDRRLVHQWQDENHFQVLIQTESKEGWHEAVSRSLTREEAPMTQASQRGSTTLVDLLFGDSKRDAAQAALQQLSTALDLYRLDNGRYPATLEGLVNEDGKGWSGPYLYGGQLPKDPWGNDYIYTIDEEGRIELYSTGGGEEKLTADR